MKWKGILLGGCAIVGLMFMSQTEVSAQTTSPLKQAETLIGTPYHKGGINPKTGFDASGFIQYVYKTTGAFDLPRKVIDKYQIGESVSWEKAKPGDLVYFRSLEETKDIPTHVALYAGNDQVIHITLSQGVVKTDVSKSKYWTDRFYAVKRLPVSQEMSDDQLVKDAMKYLGIPYVFGASDPKVGFDCSGFLQYLFEKSLGIYLPRSAEQQWMVGEKVARDDIRPGDFVFFSNTYKKGISHVGMYIGGDRFIHASRSESVTISYLSESYWREKWTGAKRLTELKLAKEDPVVSKAATYIGEVPYVKGGASPKQGFDTAGFTQYIYQEVLGMEMPRYAPGQVKAGTPVKRSELKPGDLVFFKGTSLMPAIYAGSNQVIHVTVSNGVVITNMKTSTYWKDKYETAVRIKK
ncbi:C40 family peptidase [Bacillus altitudinis]|uniref:C40 family peptidase n=1 Tax=Bacillus altitudinis TaxID=293387 RepID=UPI0009AECFC4|nr:C40 family peptidase [Bacillus altitudinis]OPW93993.1 gamma-glutamyl hydrolase [Bacillus altitudinis]